MARPRRAGHLRLLARRGPAFGGPAEESALRGGSGCGEGQLAHGLSGLVVERGFRRVETDAERLAAAESALGCMLDRIIGA